MIAVFIANYNLFLAGLGRFELPLNGSKPCVLPLDYSPIQVSILVLNRIHHEKVLTVVSL